MQKLKFLIIIGMTWSYCVCASDWETELIQTEQLISKAKESNGLWRDTAALVDKAKSLNSNGDRKTAYKLLLEAKLHAQLGHQQATQQLDNVYIPYYLKR